MQAKCQMILLSLRQPSECMHALHSYYIWFDGEDIFFIVIRTGDCGVDAHYLLFAHVYWKWIVGKLAKSIVVWCSTYFRHQSVLTTEEYILSTGWPTMDIHFRGILSKYERFWMASRRREMDKLTSTHSSSAYWRGHFETRMQIAESGQLAENASENKQIICHRSRRWGKRRMHSAWCTHSAHIYGEIEWESEYLCKCTRWVYVREFWVWSVSIMPLHIFGIASHSLFAFRLLFVHSCIIFILHVRTLDIVGHTAHTDYTALLESPLKPHHSFTS